PSRLQFPKFQSVFSPRSGWERSLLLSVFFDRFLPLDAGLSSPLPGRSLPSRTARVLSAASDRLQRRWGRGRLTILSLVLPQPSLSRVRMFSWSENRKNSQASPSTFLPRSCPS